MLGFRLAAVVLGLLQVWAAAGRNLFSGDATSYLDMADAFGRADAASALNAFWSPLYPLLLAPALAIFKPSPGREILLVSVFNFALYLCSLACFEFFLREFVNFQARRETEAGASATPARRAWLVFGYALFLWSALAMNYVPRVSPDVLVAAAVFAASGLLVRMRARRASLKTYALYGLALGLGYWAKAVMFPLAFVFLLSAWWASGASRRASARVAAALLVFACVAAPLVAVLTRAKGRPTFGESGPLNYAWHVSGEPRFIHWQGDADGPEAPAHPTRRIFDAPAAYEFGVPLVATYPPWYDPSYWNEGLRPRFDPRKQLRALTRNAARLLGSYSPRSVTTGLAFALLVMLYANERRRRAARALGSHLFLLTPALAAFAGYLLIHVELRYLAAFAVVLCLTLLACARPGPTRKGSAAVALASLAVFVSLALSVVPSNVLAAYQATRAALLHGGLPPNAQAEAAVELRRAGVGEGERVASIGETMFASWPRLARVRVVAEVPRRTFGVAGPETGEAGRFWAADEETKARLLEAFGAAGARAVVADDGPEYSSAEGWQRLGSTRFRVYLFGPEEGAGGGRRTGTQD